MFMCRPWPEYIQQPQVLCFIASRLIILLRACDVWVSLVTLPGHGTIFLGRFQKCKADNRLDWTIAEAISKSTSMHRGEIPAAERTRL